MRMRNPDDVAMAMLAVVGQLSRRDIGATHQRAMLNGMLAALNWVEGRHVPALQRIVDGENIACSDGAMIAGPPHVAGKHIIT